ncbi:hypothetical protein [Massilia yuzhufengensis]|uniref:Toxin CptA n=1 Tax=Massilia yuzhufengensis TaxID=1164594 RepID=A0A1I1SBR5_9BURK|nr:hypothetical protein [Massilia yuzhufengensis]SFD43857.1 hypothetical protein SAMN05216204_12522 [Massilia yuzhufengensis]
MPIALTVVIAPSRRLRWLLAGFAASLCAAACAVGLLLPFRFTGGPLVAAALLFAGLCVAHAALRRATVHRIDISGPGQLRLTVQQGVRIEAGDALPVAILPGSTLWPRLLMLRFGAPSSLRGRCAIRSVAVLPDSVAPEAFRVLAVALGAGAGQAGVSSTEHKIL